MPLRIIWHKIRQRQVLEGFEMIEQSKRNHDIRNQLQAALSFSELLKMKQPDNEYVDEILKAVKKVIELFTEEK